jgi:succinate-semialdehyde dehydrogenase/glutarate-semialdehyde dehydrogenase
VVAASERVTGIPDVDPTTGRIRGYHVEHDAATALDRIARARAAQPGWASRPLGERRALIRAFHDLLVEDTDGFAACISESMGKTRSDALAGEVMPAVIAARHYQRRAERLLAPFRPISGSLAFLNYRTRVQRMPYGVVGIIAPSNYPLSIPVHEGLPALLAGNTVVFKTAEETIAVGDRLADLLHRAGVPEDVFQALHMRGPIAGEAFLDSAGRGVDKLLFTGSNRVGKLLMAKSAETLTPMSLELGGNDAMLICPDADLQRAAGAVLWAGMSSSGQTCAGIERIYVHQTVHDAFIAELKTRIAGFRVRPDRDHDSDMGPLAKQAQLETVRRHVADATERGATIVAQSEPTDVEGGGFWHPAMVLTDVDHDMAVMREETFGPVVAVMAVDDMDQAIDFANDSDLGLTGSVWSRDTGAAEALARRIQAGVVMINDHKVTHGITNSPWSGFKASGIGVGHGDWSFDLVTQIQAVTTQMLPFLRRNPWWHPYSRAGYDGLKALITLLHGRGLLRRIRAIPAALGALLRTLR